MTTQNGIKSQTPHVTHVIFDMDGLLLGESLAYLELKMIHDA